MCSIIAAPGIKYTDLNGESAFNLYFLLPKKIDILCKRITFPNTMHVLFII